jgi:hypothetical protein
MSTRGDFFRWHLRFAGVVLATALAWAGWQARPLGRVAPGGMDRLEAEPAAAPDLTWVGFDGAESPLTARPRSWTRDQSVGGGVFDHPDRGSSLGVTPPDRPRPVLDLVATRELPFRLQLIGHFGEGANLSGIFAADGLAGPLLARNGEELPELGLTVEAIVTTPDAAENPDRVVARVRDQRAARLVELPESVRARSGVGAALLAPHGLPGEAIEFLVGEVVEIEGQEFRVESIDVSPASVRLRRLAGIESDETVEDLTLPAGEDSES